jgi:hypothetical protein
MNRSTFASAVALIYFCGGLTATTAPGTSEVPAERAAAIREGVQATLDSYRQLSAAGRWEGLIKLYAEEPNFRWVTNGRIVARSVDEIRKYLQALPPGTRFETTYEGTEILPVTASVAEVVTHFQTQMRDDKGGGFGFGGMLTMTLVERQGSWKILSGHASSEIPNH